MVVRSKNESRMQMSMVMKARMQMRIWMKAIEDVNEDETLVVRSRATFTPSPARGCTPPPTAQCAHCTVGSPCIQNCPVYDTGG